MRGGKMTESFEELTPEIEKPEQGLTTLAGILISLLVAIIAGAGVWYYYQYKVIPDLEKKASIIAIQSQTQKNLEIKSVDETWNQYTNNQHGFSIKIPKKTESDYGVCSKNQKGAYETYGSQAVTVFSENNHFYITQEKYANVSGPLVGTGTSSQCKIANNTLAITKENSHIQSLNFIIDNVKNEQELLAFLQKNIDPKIKIKSITKSGNDLYNVSLDASQTEQGALGGLVVIKYSQDKQKVALFELGNAPNLCKSHDSKTLCATNYDNEVAESVTFK